MKIVTSQEILHQPLSLLSRYVSARPALPVLANILIEAQHDTVTLSATNLDVTIKATISATVEQEGSTTIPARLLNEVISTLPAGKLSLVSDDNQCHIQSEHTDSVLNIISAQDFPALPNFSVDSALKLPLKVLNEVADKVLFAAATDESRPVFTNLLLQPQDSQLSLVATDGFRLSEVLQPADNYQLPNDRQLLLPARLISEMLRLNDLKQGELYIDVTSQSNQVGLQIGQITCFSKLIDATYPPYLRIIPTDFVTTITIEQSDLSQAIKIASVFAKDSGSLVRLHIKPIEQIVMITAQSAASGQHQSTIAMTGEGEDMTIAFNARYIQDALNAFGTGPITIKFKSDAAPMLLSRPDQPNFRHIIMPIKVDN
jgi:DNA polymerase-3 subunit beta